MVQAINFVYRMAGPLEIRSEVQFPGLGLVLLLLQLRWFGHLVRMFRERADRKGPRGRIQDTLERLYLSTGLGLVAGEWEVWFWMC